MREQSYWYLILVSLVIIGAGILNSGCASYYKIETKYVNKITDAEDKEITSTVEGRSRVRDIAKIYMFTLDFVNKQLMDKKK